MSMTVKFLNKAQAGEKMLQNCLETLFFLPLTLQNESV